MYKKFFFIFCLFLIGCSSLNINSLLNEKNFLITETGLGETEESSRAAALSLLNQDILVKVENTYSSKEELINNKFFTSYKSDSILVTKGFFEGLTFKSQKISKNQYKTTVGLSSSALINTITFLDKSLKQNQVDVLSKSDLKLEQEKVLFLTSLLLYAQSNNVYTNQSLYNQLNTYLLKINDFLSNKAKVKFNVSPAVTFGQVSINNASYSVFDYIFLPEGSYTYTIKSSGYKDFEDTIEVLAGDTLTLNASLQKPLLEPLKANIIIDNKNNNINSLELKNIVIGLLKKYQINFDAKSSYTVRVSFDGVESITNNTTKTTLSTLSVTAILEKNSHIFNSKTQTVRFIALPGNTINKTVLIKNLNNLLIELTKDDILSKFKNM